MLLSPLWAKRGSFIRPFLATIPAVLTGFGNTSPAYALGGPFADTVVVTPGNNIPSWGFLAASPGGFGSVSPTTTIDQHPYYALTSGHSRAGYITTLGVSGFVSDPGSGWLTSVSCNGVTLQGSAATHVFGNGSASWRWNSGGTKPTLLSQTSPSTCTVTHNAAVSDLSLKYQILAVDYAPPGAASNVNYAGSTARGTSTSNQGTWTSSTMVSVSFYRGADFIGLAKGKVTATASKEWTQEQDNSSSVAITATTTATDIIKGPASSALGVDHDYDVIWVWVNPMVRLVVAPNSIQLATYAFNGKDNANEMEVIPLYVYWLKSPSTIPANVAARLARSWDTSGLGGLTAADYANILLADLFASASYNPNSDATGRFDLQAGQTFTYEPPPPGGQPITQQFSVQAQTTSTTGQSATSTYKTSFSIDFDTGADVIATLGADLKASSTYTTTDKWSSSVNRTTTKTASLSITGPATSDNYTGPTQFQVWRDNIYGSFMFYPVQ